MAQTGPARASRFRRIGVGWTDDVRLRAVSDTAFRAYWALRCGPAMGPAIGLCRAGAGQLADLLRWDYERAESALVELHGAGVIGRDRDAGLVYFPGAVSESPPPNRNSMKAAIGEIASMPASELRDRAFAELEITAAGRTDLAGLLPGAADQDPAPSDSATVAQPLHNDSATVAQPLRNDSATSTNNQDQDQYQGQYQYQEQGASAHAGAREPEPPPIVASDQPETQRPQLATRPQQRYAASLLKPHGLTVAGWLEGKGHDELLDVHVDEIKARYKSGQAPPVTGPRGHELPEIPDPDLSPEDRARSAEALQASREAMSWQ